MEAQATTDAGSHAADKDPIGALQRDRARLAAEADGIGGLLLAQRHAGLFDEALVRVWDEAISRTPGTSNALALVALGGYGRRELCPFSDIDLMVLYGGRRTDTVSAVSEAVFYPLWNAGFDVGHAARSVKDCLALASSELESATTLLDARLIAGDRELFDQLRGNLVRRLTRKHAAFLADSREMIRTRWETYGEGAYVLEPHVKEGFGGLRDVHHLLWTAGVLGCTASLEGLADAGYLSEHNRELLAEAFDWQLKVRAALHYLAGRKTDRLYVDYQKDLAKRLGYKGVEGFSFVDEFMRDYHARAARIKHVATLFWSPFEPRRGPILARPAWLATLGREATPTRHTDADASALSDPAEAGASTLGDPAAALALFAEAARRGDIPTPQTVDKIDEELSGSLTPMTWSKQSRDDFLSVLAAGPAVVGLLESMNDIGLLSRLLPHWDEIRYRPSAGAYHHFTVDMHSFRALAELARMADGQDDPTGLARQLCAEVGDLETLRMATLLHDIGKGGPNHAERGAGLAEEICRHSGLADGGTVPFLVANHLLLPVTATRRDIDERHLIESIADRIQTVERLKMLYLLSVADSVATGPAAWNEWKAALVRELFFNVLHVLEAREGLRDGPTASVSEARAAARDALAHQSSPDGEPSDDIAEFLRQLPDSYFAGFSADAIPLHFELVRHLAPGEIHTLARATRAGDAVEFAVGAPDRPGLLAKVAGVLALNSRNILAAQTYSLANGTALQVFLTTGYFDHGPEETDWDDISEDVRRALFGKMAIDYRLARKLAAYKPNTRLSHPAEIIVENDVTPSATVIEVHADDRIGLLYTIAKALHDLDLDIRVAKVSTSADRAVDAFYVVDAHGAKVEDATHIEEIKRGVEHQLDLG